MCWKSIPRGGRSPGNVGGSDVAPKPGPVRREIPRSAFFLSAARKVKKKNPRGERSEWKKSRGVRVSHGGGEKPRRPSIVSREISSGAWRKKKKLGGIATRGSARAGNNSAKRFCRCDNDRFRKSRGDVTAMIPSGRICDWQSGEALLSVPLRP